MKTAPWLNLHSIGYAVVLGLGAFALQWIEYRYLARAHSIEVLTVVLVTLFLALGVWVGTHLRGPAGPTVFERNDAALRELGITEREYSVLERLAEGRSNKEIAKDLGISPNTVKTHLARIFAKLQVENRTQAVAEARAFRLIA